MKKINKKVLQFGPGRTGTTLIWQILKKLFTNVGKEHSLNEQFFYDYIVITYRDFRDALLSAIIVNDGVNNINVEGIKEKFLWYEQYLISLDDSLKSNKPKLYLQYELFYNNYDYIFDELEEFFNISIDDDIRNQITNEVSIESNKKIANKYETFKDYDSNTYIHGQHINNPMPGFWKTLEEEEKQLINNLLEPYLEKWYYK